MATNPPSAPRRFPPLEPARMTEAQRQAAAAMMDSRKSLDGPFSGMLRSPDLGDRLQRVGHYVRFMSPVPESVREIAILLTARHWSAQFEWHAHRKLAEAAGIAPAVCEAIARGERPAGLDAAHAAGYDFAASLLATGQVDDGAFDAVVREFGEAGAADLIGTVGYYTTVSFFLNVDRFPVPGGGAPLAPLGRQ
ncbi:MAG: carboxymuconolactone decarboxylase family protein [Proteobacteria bacterium]|nr:carboxymuconolactone decarboxylase family protein [Pseudomonadota bacterium]